MVFSSLLFVFAFLAPQLLIYFICKKTKTRNIVLLVFSLIFYAWGGPKYLILLVGEAFVSWFCARAIELSEERKKQKKWLILECVILFGLLLIFKYTGFIFGNIQALFGWPQEVPTVILPIGISFYTFQLVSYVVDVYKGEVKAQPKFWKVLLYCSLFHQCIAGPIVRYQTVSEEIDRRSITAKDFTDGIRRFSVGLAKKAILANGCANIADTLIPGGLSAVAGTPTLNLYLGMFAYMLQIYLDFSAYSDMAIGMGRMVGFHYLENFDYPYAAKSVQGFWRKWHISLSTFFRDYVYIPLGGSRNGKFRTYINLFVVWFLTGMWHGASWNFILWGLYYFVFLVLERLFLGNFFERIRPIFGHIYTLVVVFFGWVLFKFTDFSVLKEVLAGLFGGGHAFVGAETGSVFVNNLFFLILATIAVFPVGKKIRNYFLKRAAIGNSAALFHFVYFVEAITPAVLIVLAVLALVGNSYNPFLYFQF